MYGSADCQLGPTTGLLGGRRREHAVIITRSIAPARSRCLDKLRRDPAIAALTSAAFLRPVKSKDENAPCIKRRARASDEVAASAHPGRYLCG